MNVAHENSPAAGRRADQAKTTQSSRRSWPSEKHRADSLGVKDRGIIVEALGKAFILSC